MGLADTALRISEAEIQRRANAVNKELATVSKKLTEKYTKLAEKKLKIIFHNAEVNFHNGYSPIYYRRKKGAIEGVCHVHTNTSTGELIIDFTESLPGHQSGGVIFHYVFEEGYHGGSEGTDSSGETASFPTYRSPTPLNAKAEPPYYSYWSYPAEHGKAPYDDIKEQVAICEAELNEMYFREAYALMDNILAKYGFSRG